MNEDKGSAEQQAQRMDERAAEAKAAARSREGEGYRTTGWEARGRARRRSGRGVLENPAAPLIVGLALLGGIAAALVVSDDRGQHGLRSLGRRSRGLADAFRDPDLSVRTRALATLARLAAIGLAGVTWRWVRAIGRDARGVILP
jgi:hypothetical protein